MDILKILRESADDLIPEDLDFFETELATNDFYNEAYIQECKEKIKKLRAWMSNPQKPEKHTSKSNQSTPKGIIIEPQSLVPEGAGGSAQSLTPVQQVKADLKTIRERSDYKSSFKKYIKGSEIIDEAFLDKSFSMFDSWEMDAIVSVKQLDEGFLEKYFGAISHEKIARYQQFSEGFFMKHFSQLDTGIVLEHGKNEWRKKGNRSKQLDVFLRLKGVKI